VDANPRREVVSAVLCLIDCFTLGSFQTVRQQILRSDTSG